MAIITWNDKQKHIVDENIGGLISYVTGVFMQESSTAEHKELFGLIYANFLLKLNSDKSRCLIMK